ncbi:hypothetical protein J5N97_027524 [Dioscorea zingiberensis]|uniref:Uncharacterized protein n=1 Tax=Dioscorea zingiberensis TaxID=325984 RepID=A0A9D5C463_9LILI|nr:hypothetical protein J5N97_027524 [Dioscorea zingiberensis]
MRVSFWDFLHCPLICSSKSSFEQCSPQPVGLEEAQVAVHVEEKLSDDERIGVGKGVGVLRRSSLKKPSLDLDSEDSGKGGVKWMDFMGKELVEIREFERNDSWDSDNEGDNNPSCICVIQ